MEEGTSLYKREGSVKKKNHEDWIKNQGKRFELASIPASFSQQFFSVLCYFLLLLLVAVAVAVLLLLLNYYYGEMRVVNKYRDKWTKRAFHFQST